MTRELKRRGLAVNHKRVYRLMREDNLLCLRKRKFVATTESDHRLPVYPNLVRRMTLTGLNQLSVADLTYIRLEREFVYLAVILDAFSRRVIGWALDCELSTALTLEAPRTVLRRRRPMPGLVHHSDRGVQYASHDYTQLLQEHGIPISMSRKGNPWDNAACESFIKTLKYEEVYRAEYRDLAEARAGIDAFLEKVYNQKCLHSALGYLPPAEFEHGLPVQNTKEAAARHFSLGVFLRHGEIYHFDEGAIPQDRAPAHRNDEFSGWLFLGRLRSCRSRLRFTSRGHLAGKPIRSTIEFQRTVSSVLTVCLTPRGQPHIV